MPNVGIGVALEVQQSGMMHIKRFIPGGAAELGGSLKVGDRIRSVNGVDVSGMGQGVSRLIVGPAGTIVTLGVERSEEPNVIKLVAIRRLPPPEASPASPGTPASSVPQGPIYVPRDYAGVEFFLSGLSSAPAPSAVER